MKMNPKLLLATLIFTGSQAMAATMPHICANVAGYAAQTTSLRFTDGTWGDKENPSHLELKSDFKTYPVIKETYLGNCDEDPANPNIKEEWCRVAGGSPDVYKAEIGQNYDGNTYPL